MAQTSGRVCHFGSDCDAAVNISVEPHQRARLGLVPPPHYFFLLPCFIASVQLRLVCGCPHYLFAADYSLLDCCGLVVCLQLGLSV